MLLIWYGVGATAAPEATNAGNIGMGIVPVSFTPLVGAREIEPITFAPVAPAFEPRPIVRFR